MARVTAVVVVVLLTLLTQIGGLVMLLVWGLSRLILPRAMGAWRRAAITRACLWLRMRQVGRAALAALGGRVPLSFLNGFPLLPHLSHGDGRKLDLAFYYAEGRYCRRDAIADRLQGIRAAVSRCSPGGARSWLSLRWDLDFLQGDRDARARRTSAVQGCCRKAPFSKSTASLGRSGGSAWACKPRPLLVFRAVGRPAMTITSTFRSDASMIPKSGSRFSEKIMLKQKSDFDPVQSDQIKV